MLPQHAPFQCVLYALRIKAIHKKLMCKNMSTEALPLRQLPPQSEDLIVNTCLANANDLELGEASHKRDTLIHQEKTLKL